MSHVHFSTNTRSTAEARILPHERGTVRPTAEELYIRGQKLSRSAIKPEDAERLKTLYEVHDKAKRHIFGVPTNRNSNSNNNNNNNGLTLSEVSAGSSVTNEQAVLNAIAATRRLAGTTRHRKQRKTRRTRTHRNHTRRNHTRRNRTRGSR